MLFTLSLVIFLNQISNLLSFKWFPIESSIHFSDLSFFIFNIPLWNIWHNPWLVVNISLGLDIVDLIRLRKSDWIWLKEIYLIFWIIFVPSLPFLCISMSLFDLCCCGFHLFSFLLKTHFAPYDFFSLNVSQALNQFLFISKLFKNVLIRVFHSKLSFDIKRSILLFQQVLYLFFGHLYSTFGDSKAIL